MKVFLAFILFFTLSFSTKAQGIIGKWHGELKVQGIQLRLIFNLSQSEGGLSATMDSPDQTVYGIPVSNVSFKNDTLQLKVDKIALAYDGVLKGNEIIGTFKQGSLALPMNLSRKTIEKKVVKRPQEPKAPFPYLSEEVIFENKEANINLSGTLTLPSKEGKYPVVVLISGSGAQNRDAEIFGHKSFLVWADYLTKQGIAVLRYDDRGFGKSEGIFSTATSQDFASDVKSAVNYLKTRQEIDATKIGLIGHSEGGFIAPMLASESDDISYIVLLAGTGITGGQLLLLQQELIAKSSGTSEEDIQKGLQINKEAFNLMVNADDLEELEKGLRRLMGNFIEADASVMPPNTTKEAYITEQISSLLSPWFLYFIKTHPSSFLKKVSCPVFALNGEKDLQVPPKENLEGIEKALKQAKNKAVTIKEYSDLNHLFQHCELGLPSEYGEIEETIAPIVLKDVTRWILLQTK